MKCKKSGKKINQQELIDSWNETGSYYSTKIRYCPYCKEIIAIVKYSNEIELDINNDERYYMY